MDNSTKCSLETITADGTVSGDAVLIDGVIYATDWREIQVKEYFCHNCGDYFSEDGLYKHLNIKKGE